MVIDTEDYSIEYITEMKDRSFHTTLMLSSEGLSDAILSALEDESDHNVSIMTIHNDTDRGTTSLLVLEEL